MDQGQLLLRKKNEPKHRQLTIIAKSVADQDPTTQFPKK